MTFKNVLARFYLMSIRRFVSIFAFVNIHIHEIDFIHCQHTYVSLKYRSDLHKHSFPKKLNRKVLFIVSAIKMKNIGIYWYI